MNTAKSFAKKATILEQFDKVERVKKGSKYFYISSFGDVIPANDNREFKDHFRFVTGNYFFKHSEALKAVNEYAG